MAAGNADDLLAANENRHVVAQIHAIKQRARGNGMRDVAHRVRVTF